jgi:hypothetical protein
MSLSQITARKRHLFFVAFFSVLLLMQSNCRQDMHDQPKYESLEASDFFEDGSASRRPPEGTVARGHLQDDELLYTGKTNGEIAGVFPYQITRDILARGQERYNVFCSPCHDRVGSGRGIIVERGMKQPPSFHIVRLREAEPGHFFDVITNGYGVMYSYASRVPAHDRWAIVAYIRALQLSQSASLGDVSESDLERVKGAAK